MSIGEDTLGNSRYSLTTAATALAQDPPNPYLSSPIMYNVGLGGTPNWSILLKISMSVALSILLVPIFGSEVFGASTPAESTGFLSWLEIVKDAIVPSVAVIVAIFVGFWPHIQARYRRKVFETLILRELEEIGPNKDCSDLWYNCGKGKFMHQKIFDNPTDSKDLILSIDPNLVYFVTQLWSAFEKKDRKQWLWYLQEISLYPEVPWWFKIYQHANRDEGTSRGLSIEREYIEWFNSNKKFDNGKFEDEIKYMEEGTEYLDWIKGKRIRGKTLSLSYYKKKYDKKGEIMYAWYKWDTLGTKPDGSNEENTC